MKLLFPKKQNQLDPVARHVLENKNDAPNCAIIHGLDVDLITVTHKKVRVPNRNRTGTSSSIRVIKVI
jgi:hypothetical protein